MSAKLLLVALVCAVAYAQAGTIEIGVSQNNCQTVFGSNYTSGVAGCMPSESDSMAYFFDASNVYLTHYMGAGCNGTIDSVTAIPIGCNTKGYGSSYRTFGAVDTLPFGTFPPTGFYVSTTYVNNTATGAKATTCTVGSGIVSYQSAFLNNCKVRDSSLRTTTPSSTQGACSSTVQGSIVFNDATCTAPIAGSSKAFAACDVDGNTASAFTCPSDAPTIPDSIVVQGYTVYTNAACTLPANPTTAYLPSTCFDSQTLVCGAVNGTDGYATYQSWTPSGTTSNGQCVGSVVEQSVLAGTCVPYPAGQTQFYRKYFCDGSNPSGGSASTISVSIVATLFAAVAAVFAGRSL